MKRILIGAAVLAAMGSIATSASAQGWYGYRDYDGYRYDRWRDSDRDGVPDRREWNRDRDRDGRPDQWDRWDNRRHHHHHRYSYYRHHYPRYGYYDRGYYDDYRYRYRYGW